MRSVFTKHVATDTARFIGDRPMSVVVEKEVVARMLAEDGTAVDDETSDEAVDAET